MTDRPLRMVGVDALRDLMVRLLVAAGSERENAETAAGVFLEADLRGVGLQGLDHLPDMVRGLRNGKIRPDGKPEVVREGLAFALVDGNGGPGQPAGLFAADLAAEKAKAAGSSIVGVVNSSDVYLLGYYGERIARHGMVGLVPSDGTPTSRPFGGAERVLGSNPLVIAIPRAGRDPIVLDISTNALSMSRVRHAAYHGEDVPEADGVDGDGLPTTSAMDIWKDGAIGPLGGHKGFGLGFFIGVLSGLLVGADTGKALIPWHWEEAGRVGAKGHIYIAIDPAAFGDAEAFAEAVEDYIGEVEDSRKAPGSESIRMPGERAFRDRERALSDGRVALLEATWQRTAELAETLGVEMPV